MIADIRTVLWKEWKEVLAWGGGRSRWNLIALVGVFGVVLPLQMGPDWVTSPATLAYWAWMPMFLVSAVIADSIAGERERHTLETLLASRLPDRAILLGKVGAAVAYGIGIAWPSLILGLVTLNVAHPGELLIYPPGTAAGIAAVSLLSTGLIANAGVLVSLRAPSVRQAQQTLGIAVMLTLFVPVFGLRALPDAWRAQLLQVLSSMGAATLVTALLLLLALLNAVLFAAAMTRFRRDRLLA